MLGYHRMHWVVRWNAFLGTLENDIGTVLMFEVRSIFSIPGRLEKTMAALTTPGKVPAWLNKHAPLNFMIDREDGAKSVMEAN